MKLLFIPILTMSLMIANNTISVALSVLAQDLTRGSMAAIFLIAFRSLCIIGLVRKAAWGRDIAFGFFGLSSSFYIIMILWGLIDGIRLMFGVYDFWISPLKLLTTHFSVIEIILYIIDFILVHWSVRVLRSDGVKKMFEVG